MFYIRKPTKTTTVSIIREATATELHNYKNRFIVKPPIDEPEQEVAPGCNCGCSHKHDELLFVNINCDLDLAGLGSEQ
jgi:hypothetical protein